MMIPVDGLRLDHLHVRFSVLHRKLFDLRLKRLAHRLRADGREADVADG